MTVYRRNGDEDLREAERKFAADQSIESLHTLHRLQARYGHRDIPCLCAQFHETRRCFACPREHFFCDSEEDCDICSSCTSRLHKSFLICQAGACTAIGCSSYFTECVHCEAVVCYSHYNPATGLCRGMILPPSMPGMAHGYIKGCSDP